MSSTTAPVVPATSGGDRRAPSPGKPPRRKRSPAAIALVVLLAAGIAIPLIAVLVQAVTGYNGQPSALGTIFQPQKLQVIGNTILLGVLVIVFATLMAAPLAFLMSWTRLRRHRWIEIVIMVPFMTPPYIASISWLDFTRVSGLGDQLFGPFGAVLRSMILTPAGMAMIMASEIFAFLYLILRNHLDALPASGDEMARMAGASPWQRFRRVLAPLSSNTYALGALIVFIRAAGEFGAPVTIGNQIHFPVLVSQIYQNVSIAPLDFPSAAASSSLLLSLGVIVWGLQQWVSRKPIPLGARASRRTTVKLGGWSIAGWFWVALVFVVSVIIPYISVILGAMTILRSQPISANNLTFDYFAIVLQPGGGLQALENSATLAAIAATIATLVGLACALVIARRPRWLGRILDGLAILPDTVPTIVLAIGFIFFWNSPLLPVTPYNTPGILVLGYSIIFLPLVVQNIKSARGSIDNRLLEAAVVSGAGAWQGFVRVTLPLLMPGIISGWLLGFLLGVREVVLSTLIRPVSTQLLSPWILSEFDQGHRAESMAMAVIGVGSSTVILVLVEIWRQRRSDKRLA